MIIARPPGDNIRVHGASQGFLGLPVQHVYCPTHGHQILTAWTPTPEELEALNAGANVHIWMIFDLPPPMIVTVGDPPTEEDS